MEADFGPWAGSYDAWTLDQACYGDTSTISAFFLDPLAVPVSISVLAGTVDEEPSPVVSLTVWFEDGDGVVLYESSMAATFRFDQAGSIAVTRRGGHIDRPGTREHDRKPARLDRVRIGGQVAEGTMRTLRLLAIGAALILAFANAPGDAAPRT